ncbi:MAG: hypothetical protein WAV07_16985 [Candidatus Contendobacter sp.]
MPDEHPLLVWRFAPHNHADQADIGRQSLRLSRPSRLIRRPVRNCLKTNSLIYMIVDLGFQPIFGLSSRLEMESAKNFYEKSMRSFSTASNMNRWFRTAPPTVASSTHGNWVLRRRLRH